MTLERWQWYLKTHDGKTPDEVEKASKLAGVKDKPGADRQGGGHQNGGAKQPSNQQTVKTQPPKPPAKHDDRKYRALRRYLRDQHGISVKLKDLTPEKFPWLAFDQHGEPALRGDPTLHNKLRLSDAYRVVTTETGIYHKAYDPAKVQPKFIHHDVAHVKLDSAETGKAYNPAKVQPKFTSQRAQVGTIY